MINRGLPPCCQPDSDCADEIRAGNPPPCKKQGIKSFKTWREMMSYVGGLPLNVAYTLKSDLPNKGDYSVGVSND